MCQRAAASTPPASGRLKRTVLRFLMPRSCWPLAMASSSAGSAASASTSVGATSSAAVASSPASSATAATVSITASPSAAGSASAEPDCSAFWTAGSSGAGAAASAGAAVGCEPTERRREARLPVAAGDALTTADDAVAAAPLDSELLRRPLAAERGVGARAAAFAAAAAGVWPLPRKSQ